LRILIAVSHPSHANFFKVAARILKKEGHDIFITTLRRGKLEQIVKKEYSGFEIYTAGNHKGNRFSIIFNVNILRFLKLLKYSFVNKIDFGLSVGSFTLGAALKLLFTPNVQFDDDPERKMNILLEKLTSSRIYFPKVIEPKGKIRNFSALKEWSHLSPKYFTPDENSLKEFGLKAKEYILIRDISTGSLNYMSQDPEIILKIAEKIPGNLKVVLSLEDKNNFKKYPESWIILNEPVFDFYSLLYYSKILISTGDSMARESAMLGVPGIYCGFRDMKANDILINDGLVIHSKPENIIENVNRILNGEFNLPAQEKIRNDLLNKWDDVTELITEIVKEFDTKK
jgi:uncharacterized protein